MSVVSTRNLELFSRKFGKMLGSGIPLLKALELLQREEGESPLGAIIGQICSRVREGYTFSSCMSLFPGVFTKYSLPWSKPPRIRAVSIRAW